ncbi:AraC family transcriptional regulator [Paenibacillus alkalitolerans]|uniref:AraC family transcriptional regulator n=1 Tax=Paenibacillus alkalitolerans TaxID=2799335 RepID=UPI0018F77177|nr:AraC family transcriptional regulator [Paenibacillus alkalitolerans]
MNPLFEPVRFDGKPLLWGYRSRADKHFKGFYHWHQCCEMLFVHEGEGNVILDGHTYEIRRGMLFFFQPFQLHKVFPSVTGQCPYVRSVIHFNPAVLAESIRAFPQRHSLFVELWQSHKALQAVDMNRQAGFVEGALSMYEDAAASGNGEDDEEIALLFLQLLNAISAAGQAEEGPAAGKGGHRPLRYSEMIMQWIEQHYMEDVHLDRMAEALHLSKFHVSRVFRQETGGSITDYLTARRIKQACRLLQTTALPVERIGYEVGLPNASYFVQLFKRVVGTTPLRYRNSHRL